MRVKKILSVVAVGLGLQAGLAGGAWAQETLKIGVIAPLTGGGAPWGIAAAEAAKILAAETNANGGLDVGGEKYQVEVIAYDDQYKAADSVAAYNRLVNQDEVKLMLIHTSPAAVALKQNVEDDQIVAITSAASPNALDPDAKFMFRVQTTPDGYMPALIAWLRDNMPERRVALINVNDEVGWSFSELSEGLYLENGFEVTNNELFERAQKDFAPMLTKVIAQNPDVMDVGGVPPAITGLVMRQARELGYEGKFVKTAGPSPKEIVEAAGKEAAEGMLTVLFADPANPGYQRLAGEFKSSIGQEPNEMILPVYDGFSVLLRAVQKAGTVDDTAQIAAAFAEALPMASAQGDELTLADRSAPGGSHQVVTTTYIGVIKDGVPEVIGKVK